MHLTSISNTRLHTDHIHINETIVKLNEVDAFLNEQVNNARDTGIVWNDNQPYWIHGYMSAKSRKSVKLLRRGKVQLKQNIMPHFAGTKVSPLLTSCVTNYHALSHFRHARSRFRSNNERILSEMCTLVSEVVYTSYVLQHPIGSIFDRMPNLPTENVVKYPPTPGLSLIVLCMHIYLIIGNHSQLIAQILCS